MNNNNSNVGNKAGYELCYSYAKKYYFIEKIEAGECFSIVTGLSEEQANDELSSIIDKANEYDRLKEVNDKLLSALKDLIPLVEIVTYDDRRNAEKRLESAKEIVQQAEQQ